MRSPRVWKLANLSRLATLLVIVALLGSTTNDGAAAIGWSSFWTPVSNGFKNLFAKPVAIHPDLQTVSPSYLNKGLQRNVRASTTAWKAVTRDPNNPKRYSDYLTSRRTATESYIGSLKNAIALQKQIQKLDGVAVSHAQAAQHARELDAARANLAQQKEFFKANHDQAVARAQLDDYQQYRFAPDERGAIARYNRIEQLHGELMNPGATFVVPYRPNPWQVPGLVYPTAYHRPVNTAPVDNGPVHVAENADDTVQYARPVPLGSKPV